MAQSRNLWQLGLPEETLAHGNVELATVAGGLLILLVLFEMSLLKALAF
jgi:hypothetical protein